MAKISDIISREILDSRGVPTLETTVTTDAGLSATASVPSGASKGTYEAWELRDGDMQRYFGKGVLKAIEKIEKDIKPHLLGCDVTEQEKIDKIMIAVDGTANKDNLGANSMLSVSLSCTKAGALSRNLPLYEYIRSLVNGKSKEYKTVTPLFNVINGGLHGTRSLPFQEFMIVPGGNTEFSASLRMGAELYYLLKKLLKTKKLPTAVGDEGGFSPELSGNEQALDLLTELVLGSKYVLGQDVFLALDLASTTYYENGVYTPVKEPLGKPMDRGTYISYLISLKNKYKFLSLEDPLSEDDWDGWIELNAKIGQDTVIIGDDLLVTNIGKLRTAIEKKACNAILIKVNQIGTLTETLEVMKTARENGLKTVVSHRSGETTDDFIADLAVGAGADFVKFGSPARGERVAKYNRLDYIYKHL